MSGPAQAGLFIYEKNLECLVEFYESIAGMARLHQTDELAFLESPDIQLIIHRIPPHITVGITIKSPPERRKEITRKQALHFLIERRADNAVMGWICVSRSATSSGVGILSHWLNEAYHRCGYTAEATLTAVTVAFDRLNLDSMEGGAQTENVASIAVMRRLGMEPCGERIVWASARYRKELCIFYSVTQDKFMRNRYDRMIQSK